MVQVGEPMERQMVTELIAGNGMANFFETAAAVDELARQGHLTEKEGRISLTETGRQVGDTLAGMIPYTLRERSVKAALQLLTRIRREQENTVELEKLDHGYRVTCTIQDSASPLMSVSLRVADDMQAGLIRENFLDDPTLLYRSLLAILTGDAGMRRADTEIAIRLK